MSINFIIHSRLGQRRRAVDHTGGWCLQMDYDYEDLEMKHFSLQKGAERSADERKWIKWPVLNAAQTCVWVMSEENLRANMRLARVRRGLNAEQFSWRQVAGWHHIINHQLHTIVMLQILQIHAPGGNASKLLLGERQQSWILFSRSLNRANFLLSYKHLKFRRIKGNDCIRKI